MESSIGHYVAMGLDNPTSFIHLTKKGIGPFTFYLRNVIDALKKKEVSCTWDVLEQDSFILEPLTRLYEVCPETLIELNPPETGWFQVDPIDLDADEQFDPNPKDPLLIGRGRNATKIELSDNDCRISTTGHWQLRLSDIFEYGKTVTWTGYELSIKPLVSPLESQEHDFRLHGNKIKSRRENDSWRFWLQTNLYQEPSLDVNGMRCSYRIIRRFDNTDFQKQFPDALSSGPIWKICNQEKPQYPCANIIDITKSEMNKISVHELYSNGQLLSGDDWILREEKKGTLRLSFGGSADNIDMHKELQHAHVPNWRFSCIKRKVKEKWIQLNEPDDTDEDGTSGSILDYFFEDNVKLRDHKDKFNRERELFVLNRRPEERQLLLAHKNRGPSALPRSSNLYVQVDVGQVISQLKTAFQLLDNPFPEHRPLLELFNPSQHWPVFDSESEDSIEWQVLTDLDFKGCDYQREFVCKALATPDFAILDGPPGTGKTTAIIELILQLVQRGKRVLLAASTHAAINNVLERLQEGGYTEKVHATRIGLEDRAIGLESFVFDRQIEELQSSLDIGENDARQLVIQSANLVCGTTMGLHGLVRSNSMNLDLERNGPPFDVMIIDECSKTTFHEFLVPARLAKRWVLVGDIRQLSPFTDREQITANLDNLMVEITKDKNVTLSSDLQEACKLLHILYPYLDKLIIPVSAGVMRELRNEIDARQRDPGYKQSEVLDRILLFDENSYVESWYDHLTIIIEIADLQKYRDLMPMDAIILEEGWLQTSHAARHYSRNEWYSGHNYKRRKETISNANDVYKYTLENINKKWSEEICWRLEREYWLRFINNDNSKLRGIENQLQRLFPRSVSYAIGNIYILRNIAFPSILESLSGSGMIKRKKDEYTTLNQGFNDKERICRHTTLNYQHRMHPDISELPRELFYSTRGKQARSLCDGNHVLTKRDWSYPRYKKHRVWLNVNGKVYENANEAEAKAICHELESFCEWAKQNPKDGGENWDVAVLTFYKGQERCLRDNLRNLTGDQTKYSRFEKDGINIKLATVDFFQGQEADLVFLSMVNTYRDGFLDSPNRLNVAITRARYQLVIVGHYEYFSEKSTAELKALAERTYRV